LEYLSGLRSQLVVFSFILTFLGYLLRTQLHVSVLSDTLFQVALRILPKTQTQNNTSLRYLIIIFAMRRLAVLGAGLSGLTTAINLARERYDVDVYEKNKDVGTRFRGDLQGLENWSARKDILEELREMNIKANFDCDPFSRVTLTTYSRTKEIVFKRPLFYLVKRGSFSGTIDYGLKAQALELSIKMHFEETRSPNEVDIVATGVDS